MTRLTSIVLTALTLTLAAGTTQTVDTAKAVIAPKSEAKTGTALAEVIQESFVSEDSATAEGVTERDDVQKARSQFVDRNTMPVVVARKLKDAQFKTIHYPADNTWLGGWKEGEKTARSGYGTQFSDPTGTVNGVDCYVCCRLPKDEPSCSTIDSLLYQYGKLCGNPEATPRYTWGKIYDSNTYTACSNMPRFGHKDILIEQQIRDAMAL